ncbi:hypothetical protein D3C72_331810 [compost metagenome]
MNPAPTFALRAVLVDTALGHIERDVTTDDIDVASGEEFRPFYRYIILGIEVQIVAGIERRRSAALLDGLLAAALLAIAELDVCCRPGEELADAIHCLEGTGALADIVLALARTIDRVFRLAIVVVDTHAQTVALGLALLFYQQGFAAGIDVDVAPGSQVDIVTGLQVRANLVDIALGVDGQILPRIDLAGGTGLLFASILFLEAIDTGKQTHAIVIAGNADACLPGLRPCLLGAVIGCRHDIDVPAGVHADMTSSVDTAAHHIDIALSTEDRVTAGRDQAAHAGVTFTQPPCFFG